MTRSTRSARGRLTRRALIWGGGVALLAAGWSGCTVTKTNYATLSFFFDGVPDPNAKATAGGADATVSVAVVVHKPFAEEKCDACHKTQYRPQRNDPSACLSCHKTVLNEHAWTHGAVAGGACLWCHSPHESTRKWLLRGPDRGLCVQCHAASMLKGDVVPAHADPKGSCVSCHFGHGGPTSVMLKPGASRLAPPDEPVDASDKPKSSAPQTPSTSVPAETSPELMGPPPPPVSSTSSSPPPPPPPAQ